MCTLFIQIITNSKLSTLHEWRTPKLLDGLTASPKEKTTKGKGIGARSLTNNTLRVEGHARTSGCELEGLTSKSIIHTDLHKQNNKLVSAQLEHFWCTDRPRANTDSQNSSWPGLKGSHRFPPYNILCAWSHDQHSNVILSRDSQMGVPKFPKLELLHIWRPITLCADL